jgi:NAD-dependent deacetylase
VTAIDPRQIADIAELLARASNVLFITGAGISADSGLPTYRGIGGMYDVDHTEEGLPIEVALSGEMMRQRPELCWKYIAQVEQACRGARPNRGHEVIAALERELPRVWTLTQNVDGFHHLAGSENVIDIHGDVRNLTCTACGRTRRVPDFTGLTLPPRCEHCGGLVRPKVVLFGEMLPQEGFTQLAGQLRRGFDLVFSIGTTSVFPYIAGPVVEAAETGIPTIEINPGDSEVSHLVDHRLRAGAAAALDAIYTALRSKLA